MLDEYCCTVRLEQANLQNSTSTNPSPLHKLSVKCVKDTLSYIKYVKTRYFQMQQQQQQFCRSFLQKREKMKSERANLDTETPNVSLST